MVCTEKVFATQARVFLYTVGVGDGIFRELEDKKYDPRYCFLCGTALSSANASGEHVFPRWLQQKYDLWNQRITLLNQTTICYKDLKIPCCNACNNEHLSAIENRVRQAVASGFGSFAALDQTDLFCWLGKIYYGLMYKSLFLQADRRSDGTEPILDADYVRTFGAHHLFLQAIRGLHTFSNFFPASIFVVKLQVPTEKSFQWDFRDSHYKMMIAMRMGEIGVVSLLQDLCTVQRTLDLSEYTRFPLHPLQFQELIATVFYQYLLLNRVPKFLSIGQGEGSGPEAVSTMAMPLAGYSTSAVFDDPDVDEYAKILSNLTGIPLDRLNPEPGSVMTFMTDENGSPRHLPLDGSTQPN